MKHTHILILLLVIVAMHGTSCVHKQTTPAPVSRKISKVELRTDSQGYHFEVFYNPLDQVTKVVTTGSGKAAGINEVRTFTYTDSTCFVSINGASTVDTYTMTLNSAGMITHFKTHSYIYDHTELIRSETRPNSGTVTSTGYIWSGGNMDSTIHISSTGDSSGGYSCTYDTTKEWQQGDGQSIDDLLGSGRTFIKCRHLVSTSYFGRYSYLFDSYGRISRVVVGAGTPGMVVYDYSY